MATIRKTRGGESMNIWMIVYIALAIFMFFALLIVVLIVAGKEIYIAFYRRVFPKGCEVWIANHNRQFGRYYRVPKDGNFKIAGKTYITNPDKVMLLSDEMQREVKKGMGAKKDRINKNIKSLSDKIEIIGAQVAVLKGKENGEAIALPLIAQRAELLRKVDALKKKLEDREQVYYYQRRALFLYIEGDPVPKDLHEWMTELDSIMLDNIVARAQTKDPKAIRDLEQTLKFQKYVTIGLIIVGAILAFLVFQNNGILKSLADSAGITITV